MATCNRIKILMMFEWNRAIQSPKVRQLAWQVRQVMPQAAPKEPVLLTAVIQPVWLPKEIQSVSPTAEIHQIWPARAVMLLRPPATQLVWRNYREMPRASRMALAG